MKKAMATVSALLAIAVLEAGAFAAAPAPVVGYYYQFDHYGNMQLVPVEYQYEERVYPVTYYEKRVVLRPRPYRTRTVYNVAEPNAAGPVITMETAAPPAKAPAVPVTGGVSCGCAAPR
ncbi:MAG: hypothetical protein LBC93_02710 [Synergistaceae bacterium]|jgi:hypothetical protein|nr:hypothetical protein [Synergistaceae bacterium]